MALQFQLFAVLGRLPGAPPVPRVIYYCDDVQVLGAPFYLVERAAGAPFGDYAPADWVVNASESFRGELSLQYVQAIASLSKLQPLDVLGPVKTPREECLRWRSFAKKGGHELLATLLDRLIAAEPPRGGPPALVHGDPKMSNILWLGGRLQSVLDWELAFNGEPLSDLGLHASLSSLVTSTLPRIGFDLPGSSSEKRQQIDIGMGTGCRTPSRRDRVVRGSSSCEDHRDYSLRLSPGAHQPGSRRSDADLAAIYQ